MQDSFDRFCSVWPGADPGGLDEGMHLPTSHFHKCFTNESLR